MYDHMRSYHHREEYVKFRLTKMPGQDLQCPKCLWYFVHNVSETHKCKLNKEESIRLFGQRYSVLDPDHQEPKPKKKTRKRQRSSDEWDEPSEPEPSEPEDESEDPDYAEEPSDGEGFKPDSIDDGPDEPGGPNDLIDPSKCPHCEKELCDRTGLLMHLKGVHGKEAYLKYHMTPMGPYKSKCPTCGLCFQRRIHHKRKHCLETYELAKGTEFEFEIEDENDTSVLDGLDSDNDKAAGDKEQPADSTALVKACEVTPKRTRNIIELTENEIDFKPEDCDDFQCPFCDHRASDKAKNPRKVIDVGDHIKKKHGMLAYLKYRTTAIGSAQTQCKTCNFHYINLASHDIRHCHKVMMMAKGTPYEFQIDQEKLAKMERMKARVLTITFVFLLSPLQTGVSPDW